MTSNVGSVLLLSHWFARRLILCRFPRRLGLRWCICVIRLLSADAHTLRFLKVEQANRTRGAVTVELYEWILAFFPIVFPRERSIWVSLFLSCAALYCITNGRSPPPKR
jgi:hypothetical protein